MRYQSTPEKEFDGDIIITDPCYIIRKENEITKNDWHYCECGGYMERLGIKNYLTMTPSLETGDARFSIRIQRSRWDTSVQMPVSYPYFCWMKFLLISRTSITT